MVIVNISAIKKLGYKSLTINLIPLYSPLLLFKLRKTIISVPFLKFNIS